MNVDKTTKQQILHFIQSHPGVHLSKIAEQLHINITKLDKILQEMIGEGSVTATQELGVVKYSAHQHSLGALGDRRTEETRKTILSLVQENPGLHLSKIAELLEMSTSLAEYHLLQLEKNGYITSMKDAGGLYRRYYGKDHEVGPGEKKILSVLRKKKMMHIVLLLLRSSPLQHKEFLKELQCSASLLSYYLTKLVEYDVIEVIAYGDDKGYRLKNRSAVLKVIRSYNLGEFAENVMDTWKDMNLFD